MNSRIHVAAILGALACATAPAFASTVNFHADIKPAMEVPPVTDSGSGTADATLNTASHVLTYTVTFGGFGSPVTMAHFHGPAPTDKNAPVTVPLGTYPTSPLHGTVTLTPEQQTQLMGGLWYANVHTKLHPKGAGRGQMVQK